MEKLERYLCENNIPTYSKGEVSLVDVGDECVMIYAKDTALEDFREYCGELVKAGFELYGKREIEGNEFDAYVKEGIFAYAYYSKYNNTVRVVVGDKALFGYEDWLNKKGYCLDKDTINPDNKVYSRKNCCFIQERLII